MKKIYIFLLLFLISNLSASALNVEVTNATMAAAAKAPKSKLVGEWNNPDLDVVFKSNGTGYIAQSVSVRDYLYFNFYVYKYFKYSKNGGELIITPTNNYDCGPQDSYSQKIWNGLSRKKKQEIEDGIKSFVVRKLYSYLDWIEGTIEYLGDGYLVINSHEFENEKFIEKHKQQREEKRIAEEKKKAAEAEALRRMKEAWDIASATNTLDSYRSFLQNYPTSEFDSIAKNNIYKIETQNEWNELKKSNDINALNTFVDNHPDFEYLQNVQSRLYALEGLKYYEEGNKETGIEKFKLVTLPDEVPLQAHDAYIDALQAIEYQKLSINSSENELTTYLSEFPHSVYVPEVKNYLAEKLASNFNLYSTQRNYDEALSLASGQTLNKVESAIIANEDKKEVWAIQQKKERRKENGGYGSILIEACDLTWNGRNMDGLFQYNFGVKLKFGNFADRVQFAVGVKPGVGVWDFKGVYNPSKYDQYIDVDLKPKPRSFFEMPVEAELRINLARLDSSSWFYIDGRYDYNLVRNKRVQTPMAFYAGFGFGGKYVDITFFYGRQLGSISSEYSITNELPNPFMDSRNNNNFGLSISANIPIF